MTTRDGQVEIETGAGLPEDFVLQMLKNMNYLGNLSPTLFTTPDKTFRLRQFTCAHCQANVLLAPTAAIERPKCSWCAKNICRKCGAKLMVSNLCVNRAMMVEKALERQALEQQLGTFRPLIIPT